MKKVIFVLMAICLVSSLAFAADSAVTTTATDTNTAAATELSTTTTTQETSVEATPMESATPATTTTTQSTVTIPATTTTTTSTVVTTPKMVVLNGDVIDNMCAGANKANLADFVKTHTKECALKPGCMASGYSIFADGKLYGFDKDSSAKVAEFLKKADSKLQVTITAKQVGDELTLFSIVNQN